MEVLRIQYGFAVVYPAHCPCCGASIERTSAAFKHRDGCIRDLIFGDRIVAVDPDAVELPDFVAGEVR